MEQKEEKLTLVLNSAGINLLLKGLGELPLKEAFNITQDIQVQLQDQMKAKEKK